MSAKPLEKPSNASPTKPNQPYSAYYMRSAPVIDTQITHAGPGTPLGELMRRFWQPICLSEQLRDVPLAVRILNEELVVFKDGKGQIGVLQKQCCHRGASLEYGIIQECGIRCCYHGFHFDIDGTILEAPAARDKGERLAKNLAQGAYPAMERDGLIFAYMGPPESRPPFAEYDAFEKRGDTRLVAFSNIYPCNWLQVIDNIADQMHTSFLHNMPYLYNGNVPEGLPWEDVSLPSFAATPIMDYVEVRNGTAMCFIAGRRMGEDKVWIRIQDCIVPNMTEHAYLFEQGNEHRIFHRVSMARWYVPVDDHNCIIFGWRTFGKEADPLQRGTEERVGYDNMDFLMGQVGNRSYEEAQRLPGDWEAITSMGPIVSHERENPIDSDAGVYMFRKLLRNAVDSGSNMADNYLSRAFKGQQYYCYTQNNVLAIPKHDSKTADEALIRTVGRKIIELCQQADELDPDARRNFMTTGLLQLEKTAATL